MRYIFIALILSAWLTAVHAQDRVFAYTYQSNVLNTGSVDFEFQNTLRTGKVGPYSPYIYGQHLDQRLELEVGLGGKVQTAFYINSELFHYADTSSDGMNQDLKISFSNEWKWKISDPVANAVGTGLYGEIEAGGSNIELEGKLIFDKQFPHDLVALNIAGKYELEREISRVDKVTKATWVYNSPIELYLGYMHFFSHTIGLGLEARNNNDITQKNGWMNSVFFAGPVFHVSIDNFMINFSSLPQIVNLHKTKAAPGSRDLDGFEAAEIRLLVGYSF